MGPTIKTCLWYDGQAEEAANFYVSLIPGSEVRAVWRPSPGAPAMTVEFSLAGTPYQALNGGPMYQFTEAASISVTVRDQAEVDRLWAALTEGGEESQCGWLKDRYGLSWQIIPEALFRFLGHPDPAAAKRAMQAMLQMRKLDVAALERAVAG